MKHLITAAALALALSAYAEGQPHHVAIHVDDTDPQVMTRTLNNARNVANKYPAWS